MRMINDKAAYIKEIQHFLSIAIEDSGIIFENGIYDEVTKKAVSRFKSENGMNADSVIDRETYEYLYKVYLKKADLRDASFNFSKNPDDILKLNMMLRGVLENYSEIEMPRATKYYSKATEKSVSFLRRIYRLGEGGADGEFMKKLTREYELTKNISGNVR